MQGHLIFPKGKAGLETLQEVIGAEKEGREEREEWEEGGGAD